MEHRLSHQSLDHTESDEHGDTPAELGDDDRVRPAHGVVAVGLDPIGDPDEQRDQTDGKGHSAPPVDPCGAPDAPLLEPQIGPDRAADAERNRDQEDEAPVERTEQAAQDETDERPGDGGHVVDPERQAPLVGRERVRQDRRRIRHEHRRPETLHDPHADQIGRSGSATQPVDRQQDRAQREDGKAQLVHPDSAEDVADTAERDDEHGSHDQEAHQHPEEIAHVAGSEWIDADTTEDVR